MEINRVRTRRRLAGGHEPWRAESVVRKQPAEAARFQDGLLFALMSDLANCEGSVISMTVPQESMRSSCGTVIAFLSRIGVKSVNKGR